MLTIDLVLLGGVLLLLTLGDRAVRRWPLSPAVIYLVVGWTAGALLGAPGADSFERHAPALTIVIELAVLASLFAVGLRLRVPPRWKAWRVALLMAGPGMVAAIVLGAAAALWLLPLGWPAALLLGAMLSPTDPVLASEVQIRADGDRDAVRLSITAEGGLNDGTALPAVMLALGLLGLHELGAGAARWWWEDLLLPIGGGLLLGVALGLLLGRLIDYRLGQGDTLARDELLYVGAITLAYGLARSTHTSSFVVMFAVGATLLLPVQEHLVEGGQALAERMQSFGARCERLVEAASVLAVGVALHSVLLNWRMLAFGLLLVLAVRPLSVWLVVRRGMLTPHQRRLVAWFGIRGVGTLYYLVFALQHGVTGGMADQLIGAALTAIAISILLHGISATPLMTTYQRRRGRRGGVAPVASDAAMSLPPDQPEDVPAEGPAEVPAAPQRRRRKRG